MKTKSTYSLLLNADSEEKGRSIFETATYTVVVLSMALSVWYFASGAVTLPGQNRADVPTERVIANTPEEAPLIAARANFNNSPRETRSVSRGDSEKPSSSNANYRSGTRPCKSRSRRAKRNPVRAAEPQKTVRSTLPPNE